MNNLCNVSLEVRKEKEGMKKRREEIIQEGHIDE